ncbi:PTS transporter subunit EIIC, partial [Enterococcus faecalis]|uniref:PTS transporter subunit EIIC n=1 Tax=Enterococcus faecalis TaxID=1351 RepID=UPI003D6A35EC
ATRAFQDVVNIISAGLYINLANLGSACLFAAIVTALLSVEIYSFFIEKNIMIKMPDVVPPEVSNSFNALIPVAIILL